MALFTYPPVSVDTSGLATEATLLQVETNTASTVTEIQSSNTILNAIENSVATESTLQDTVNELQAANTTLTSLDGKDFATQTTLADALTELQGINSNDFATEPTLTDVKTATEGGLQELQALNAKLPSGLVPEAFDYQALTYVVAGNGQGEIETVTYKTGGAGGTTVATLTLAYDGSNRLSSVTRS